MHPLQGHPQDYCRRIYMNEGKVTLIINKNIKNLN